MFLKQQNIHLYNLLICIIFSIAIVAGGILCVSNRSQTPHFDTWMFVYVADIQVGSPRSFRFQPAWNENWETARKQIIDINPEFLLIGGDPTLGFFKYDVSTDKIEKSFIPLAKVSTRKGYGPGGHPSPEERDYSKAWEKKQGIE